MQITVANRTFGEGRQIPKKYTADGKNLSPPLKWDSVPKEAKELALIVKDPIAPNGDFVHWTVFNIPAKERGLKEGVQPKAHLSSGAKQGKNSFGQVGHDGPEPPDKKVHQYHFELYALDRKLNLKPGATKELLRKAISGHVIEKAELLGTYKRGRHILWHLLIMLLKLLSPIKW
jgi:Raf kinase inhibitor-like YbhB/YbcL family protein